MSNEVATVFIETMRELVIKHIVKQAMKAILAKLPFLSWGPLGWITSYLLTNLVTFLADKTILGATLLYIDVSNGKKVKAVDEAIEKVQNAKTEGATVEEIKKLDDELAEAGFKLIKLTHLK